MGMLTGSEILKQKELGRLDISDFDITRLNPNSYNVRLDDVLLCYAPDITGEILLDPKYNNAVNKHVIPETGMILYPGTLYLGSTIESTHSDHYVACIDGRSSIARLGLKIHETAGFGDIGFNGKWTLEITVTHPIKVYPGMEIGQVYFTEPVGDTDIKYTGKYQNASSVIKSKMYVDKSWE